MRSATKQRCAPGSTQGGTVSKQASIHYREDPGVVRAFGGGLIDDAILEPQGGEPQADAFADDPRNMLGPAKHIHDIHMLTRAQHVWQMRKVWYGLLAEDNFRGRSYGNDPITETLQSARHTMTRPRRVRGESDHRYDTSRAQKLGNLLAGGIGEHGSVLGCGSR